MRRLGLAAVVLAGLGASPAAMAQPNYIVFFPLWSGALDDAANSVIAQAATQLKPGGEATVTGFADSTGSQQANIYLTQLRAQRVIDGLEADGVPAGRLTLVAKGAQEEPGIASRRVEIKISP